MKIIVAAIDIFTLWRWVARSHSILKKDWTTELIGTIQDNKCMLVWWVSEASKVRQNINTDTFENYYTEPNKWMTCVFQLLWWDVVCYCVPCPYLYDCTLAGLTEHYTTQSLSCSVTHCLCSPVTHTHTNQMTGTRSKLLEALQVLAHTV